MIDNDDDNQILIAYSKWGMEKSFLLLPYCKSEETIFFK